MTPGKAFRCQDLNDDLSEGINTAASAPTNSQTCSENHSDHEHLDTHSSVCDSESGEDSTKKPLSVVATPFIFRPAEASSKQPSEDAENDLDINFDADFTPSTPYVHKFRTEMCKNFALYGTCRYGDEVSIFPLFFLLGFLSKSWIKIAKINNSNN